MKLNLLERELTFFRKALLITAALFITTLSAVAQCTTSGGQLPTGASLLAGNDNIMLCLDNGGVTVSSVPAGKFVVINVIKGINYDFRILNNPFNGEENLSIFRDNTNEFIVRNSGASGVTGFLWVSTFSGRIKLLVSQGNTCSLTATGAATLGLFMNNVGNSIDDQTESGTDKWVGHVYNWGVGNENFGSATTAPSNEIPFDGPNYVGNYKIGTDKITENFGGATNCFPVYSENIHRVNIQTTKFAVRYRMTSTKPAGYYYVTLKGDDGIKLYVDDKLIFGRWSTSDTDKTYCKNLVYLNGNSNLVLDYYDNTGDNNVNFEITGAADSNTIAGDLVINFCAGATAITLDGSKIDTCSSTYNAGFTFQWQISTNGSAFNDIGGATLEDYTTSSFPTNEVRKYRRLLKSKGLNSPVGGYPGFTVITVNVGSQGGVISGGNDVCLATNSNVLTLSGHVGNVIRWESKANSASNWTAIENTTNSLTLGALTQTTKFRAVVQSGSCPLANSTETTVIFGGVATWDGSNWSPSAPTSTMTAIINGNYSASANIDACSLTVNSGVVSIPSGFTVTLSGALKIAGGSFTLENNANLIQNGTTILNEGAITVNRSSSALKRLDYTLWSSPVTGTQTLSDFSPLTTANRFYTYNTSTDLYKVTPNTETFETAKGYLIRMPNTASATVPTKYEGSFVGKPNNGNYAVTMVNVTNDKVRRFNLVGNPYPSPINANTFITNNSANITGSLYFWRKTNAPGTDSYYTMTTAGLTSTTATNQTVTQPNGVIQTGQGFIVEAKGSSTNLLFNNAMRFDNHSDYFLRTTNIIDYNRIWLNATNIDGLFSQTMIAYFIDGSNDLDLSDGKYLNDGDIALTSVITDEAYAIQGKALPFETSDSVQLQFVAKNAGTYSIAIDHVDGLFEGTQDIFLRDTQTGVDHDLKAGAYTFVTEAGTFSERFNIVYQNMLGTTTNTFDANSVVVAKNNNVLSISAGSYTINSVVIYDLLGRKIYSKSNVDATTTNISDLNIANQVILVQIATDNGTVTKKVQF